MAYPQKLLSEGESVVLDLHTHWKAMVLPVLELLAVLTVSGYLVGGLVDDPTGRWLIGGVAALLVLVLFVVPLLRWRTTHFVVTTERVVMRSGIIARQGRDVPLSRINDVSFHHSVIERILGCGTLIVESASERGQVLLHDIPRVEHVQRTVYQLVDRADDPR
jgi:uncharacterized membrane protein YdbT with pleckstrin-like domain